jgi:ABC-type transport system involved in multi-copper enzyme maturation permease subunit
LNTSRINIGLPLLAKELTEQSARRRTYVMRVVYAVALYGFTLWTFWNQLGSWNSNSFAILGRGRELFESIAGLQFAGLYLFLPAMTCGVLTSEKERDTLALLLLTKLGPWTIVFEKLLGRLVPMWSFLLLSMPLLAVAYSLGGVETIEVINLAWALFVTTVQVGAFSILCSAWCRTTSAAFLATYLVGAAIILGPPVITQGGHYDLFGLVSACSVSLESLGIIESPNGYAGYGAGRQAVFVLFGPWLAMHPSSQGIPFPMTVTRSLPILFFSLNCLFAARLVLWRRAFIQPSNYIMRLFKSLDAFFLRANQNRWTKGIVLIHESVTLPVFDPIRWRETTKRSLGTTRYLIRILLVLEVPVLVAMLLPDYSYDERGIGPTIVACALWLIVMLVLTVQSTGLIGLERSRQTLDVLLTTQMSSDAIVREKFAGVWRMIRMLWVPFATVYLFRVWWQVSVSDRFDNGESAVVFGVISALLSIAIYPPLIAWIGFHQGMRRRSQTQATLVTLGLIVAWCVVPIVTSALLRPMFWEPGWAYNGRHGELMTMTNFLTWLSPAYVLSFPVMSDAVQMHRIEPPGLMLVLHFLISGGLLIYLRSHGMQNFSKYVNRNDGQIVDDDDIDRLASIRKMIVGSGVYKDRTDE